MALNFFTAVGIVVANKALFRQAGGLNFATSLTGLHFITTALGVRVCHAVGVYEVKPLTQTQESARVFSSWVAVLLSWFWCSDGSVELGVEGRRASKLTNHSPRERARRQHRTCRKRNHRALRGTFVTS